MNPPLQDSQVVPQTKAPAPLLFVDVGTSGKQRSKQSRAHVARVNRQRQKDERLKSDRAAKNGKAALDKGSSSNSTTLQESGTSRRAVTQTSNSRLVIRRRNVQQRPAAVVRRHYSDPTVPQLPPTLSPVFGAVEVNSFDLTRPYEAADVADFIFNRLMNSWLDPKLKPTWFAAFFQHPLVFHCLSYSCGIIQDVSAGRAIQSARLVHRLKTIQIVNSQLSNIDNVDPEPILLAITTLWRINTDQIAGSQAAPLIFTPHRRSTSWVALFGKLGGDDTHSRAMVELVRRVGGLNNFTTLPSLQETLALGDVLHSSANASKPLFSSIWDAQFFVDALQSSLLSLANDVEGSGFVHNVPGGLPPGALATLQKLSMVDKLLDTFSERTVSQAEDITLATLGDAVQHELLSLLPWQFLDQEDREKCYLATYELCRLTSIIYSNSVIFPMAPDAPWLERLLRQHRLLLETSNMAMWDENTTPLIIWSLFIAGMTSFWTTHRAFYVSHLRSTLSIAGITSWDAVKPVLEAFLWRDDACGNGAVVLWDVIQNKEHHD